MKYLDPPWVHKFQGIVEIYGPPGTYFSKYSWNLKYSYYTDKTNINCTVKCAVVFTNTCALHPHTWERIFQGRSKYFTVVLKN